MPLDTTLFTPLNITIGVAIGILLAGLVIMAKARKAKARKAAGQVAKPGHTIILLRGGSPTGAILTGCIFTGGSYTIDAKGRNPIYVPFDARFIRRNTQAGGEPFMFFDMESQHLVNFVGNCNNDDDYTIVHHDGVVEDVTAEEAKKYIQADQPDEKQHQATLEGGGKALVFRKHASLWRRWPGSRIFAEKNTNDWSNIQHTMPTWLSLLQMYGTPILIVIGLVLVVLTVVGLAVN